MASDWDHVTDLLKDAITASFREGPSASETMMLQGFVLISEWIGEDGERRIDVISDGDSRHWQLMGMVEYAKNSWLCELMVQELEEG